MNFLFIPSWFPEPISKAIGWTLIHSLWQGLLVTFIAGLMILFTKRSAASIRYKLLSFLLFAFVAGAVTTFIVEYVAASNKSEVPETVYNRVVDLAPVVLDESEVNREVGQSFFSNGYFSAFTNYFNSNAPLIVTIWFAIFLFKCLRLTANIGYAQRIRKHKVSPLPALQKRLEELAVHMKIKASVIIRESSIVKVPSVIGFLKPVILLPVGLLSNLPPDQVEAILLHELAHIRRKDYLVNILQCLVVTIFFFNPSILWLSSLIRQERENCCDDMAIDLLGTKATYINALVAFTEYRSESTYAQAFPGEKYPVLQRIKRIVYNHNKNLNNMEKIFLSSGVVLCAVLILTFSATSAQEPVKTEQNTTTTQQVGNEKRVSEHRQIDDTVRGKDFTGTITTYRDDKNYTVIVKNNVVTGLFINSERIPDERFADHKTMTDQIIADHFNRVIERKRMKEVEKERKDKEKDKVKELKNKQFEYKSKQKEKLKEEREEKKEMEENEEKEEKEEFELKSKKEFNLKNDKDFKVKSEKEFDYKGKDGDDPKKNKLFKTKSDKDFEYQKDKKEDREKIEKKIEQQKEKQKEQEAKNKEIAREKKEQNKEKEKRRKELETQREAQQGVKDDIEAKKKREREEKDRERERKNREREKDQREKEDKKKDNDKDDDKDNDNDNDMKKYSIGRGLVLVSGDATLDIQSPVDVQKPVNVSKPGAAPKPKRTREVRVTEVRSGDRNMKPTGTRLQKVILSDLQSNNLLKNEAIIVLELNFREMRLNGKKMTNDIHKKFQLKYLNGYSDRISFVQESENK